MRGEAGKTQSGSSASDTHSAVTLGGQDERRRPGSRFQPDRRSRLQSHSPRWQEQGAAAAQGSPATPPRSSRSSASSAGIGAPWPGPAEPRRILSLTPVPKAQPGRTATNANAPRNSGSETKPETRRERVAGPRPGPRQACAHAHQGAVNRREGTLEEGGTAEPPRLVTSLSGCPRLGWEGKGRGLLGRWFEPGSAGKAVCNRFGSIATC